VRRLLAIGAVAATVAVAVAGTHVASRAKATPDVSAYAGLGTWISIFGTNAYTQPDAVAAAIAARGVRTVYVQTGNFSQPTDVVKADQLGALVDALHAAGLKVVAWYLPGLVKPAVDLRRALAAVHFQTPQGGGFDGFALDIESSAVKRVAVRTSRVLALSRQLRNAVGSGFALGAIIPSPRGMELVPKYWPSFPYADLAKLYDVFLPMDYWTFSVKGPDATYGYTARSLAILRQAVGNANVPIHLVGGTTGQTKTADDVAFAQLVADDGHLAGWSLFDYFATKPAEWKALVPPAVRPDS
jgi:hypothetical protein